LIVSFPYSEKGSLDGASSQCLHLAGTELADVIRRTLKGWDCKRRA